MAKFLKAMEKQECSMEENPGMFFKIIASTAKMSLVSFPSRSKTALTKIRRKTGLYSGKRTKSKNFIEDRSSPCTSRGVECLTCFSLHKDYHKNDLNMQCCLCLRYHRFNGTGEGKPLLISRDAVSSISELFSLYHVEEGSTETEGRKSKRKKQIKEKEIKIIWANNPDTNSIFTKLGAEDIVNKYDKLLSEWKMLKDAEREFKQIMGLEQEQDLVKCLASLPPDIRIGFSHGASETDYHFHLDLDPLVSLDKLHESLNTRLRNAMQLFNTISDRLNVIKSQGELIQKDLEHILACFGEDKDTSVDIKGVQHNVQLLNIQQVRQALLIVKDMVALTTKRSFGMMDYIMQQGDSVDMTVLKDANSAKVVIYHKKFAIRKQLRSFR